MFSGMGGAVGTAEDVAGGLFDRLRSLPIPRGAVLLGRSLADTALVGWGLFVTVAVGFATGFRFHGSLARRRRGRRAVPAVRLRLDVAVHPDGPRRRLRAGRQRDGDAGVPVRVRLQRLRPGRVDAGLVAAGRRAPAGDADDRRRPGAGARRRGDGGARALGRVVRGPGPRLVGRSSWPSSCPSRPGASPGADASVDRAERLASRPCDAAARSRPDCRPPWTASCWRSGSGSGRRSGAGETVGVAEGSCGGLVSAALLAVPGASGYYAGGAVIYTLAANRAFLEGAIPTPPGLRGATEGFAAYLARSAVARLGSTWGIGEGGAAGPTRQPLRRSGRPCLARRRRPRPTRPGTCSPASADRLGQHDRVRHRRARPAGRAARGVTPLSP